MQEKEYERLVGVRNGFFLGDKYRLDLTWSKVEYPSSGICKLNNAIFSGPALQFAEQIQGDNYIMLDFCKQYLIFTKNAYVGKLSWGDVKYLKDGSVKLCDCVLTHDTELNNVPNLNSDDKLVIDTSGHDAEVHAYHPVYNTFVVDSSWKVYNYISRT